jgi:hypothetical protein
VSLILFKKNARIVLFALPQVTFPEISMSVAIILRPSDWWR